MSLGAMPQRRRAIKEDAPQSIKNVLVGALIQIQVCKRPPLPKASPLPKNLTWIVSVIGPPEEVRVTRSWCVHCTLSASHCTVRYLWTKNARESGSAVPI